MNRRIEWLWKDFESECIPPGTDELDRRMMQLAFYSGAGGVYIEVATIFETATTKSELLANLTEIGAELREFTGRPPVRIQ